MKFTLTSEYDNVIPANHQIVEFIKSNNVDDSICNKIEICLTEAINNSIKHSYLAKCGNNIEIDVLITSDKVFIHVIDYGISMRKFKKPSLEYDPKDIQNLPEGGMGLFIIDQIMDEMSYESDGNKNIFTMVKSLFH